MEPNKLEKEFRDKLNTREIQPSAAAWTKLEGMLSAEEKTRAKFPWLYVAASFVGLLLIGTAYFNLKESSIQTQKNGVVIQSPVAPKAKNILLDSTNLKIQGEDSFSNKKSVRINNKFIDTTQKSTIVEKSLNQSQTADVVIANQEAEQEPISTQTNTVTVDQLLARVDKSARLNKANPDLQVHVNPNQLLQQLDNDLEPSYRQNVFSKVAENFKAVKDAFVNRNKE